MNSVNLTVRAITVEARHGFILNRVSLDLAPGELVGLIGPNGAGKSTLLRAIVGAVRIQAGDVRLEGRPIDDIPASGRARAMAYLPQERHVEWHLPSRAVVMLGRFPHRRSFGRPSPECEAAVDRALDLVEADSFASRSAAVLSGGERTRVLLARALAVEAPLLLVDEPIAGLDPYHQLHVMEILKNAAAEGAGVLAVLHDLTLAARFMDRLILLHQGEVVDSGTPDDVLTEENLERVYQVSAVNAGNSGDRYILPWRRIAPQAD